VFSEFEDLNAYVYHSVRGLVFDGLIWCLGPYVDDGKAYGVGRVLLAGATRGLVRSWLRLVAPGALAHRGTT
jgi:hypothetical protein